jgi:anti-anti-sigma factor
MTSLRYAAGGGGPIKMTITGFVSEGVRVLRFPGIADATNSTDLTHAVEQALVEGSGAIVLDLAATEAMDSAALHVVLRAHAVANLMLVRVGLSVGSMLSLTRLDRVLRVRCCAADAIHEIRTSRFRDCTRALPEILDASSLANRNLATAAAVEKIA